MSSPKKPVGAVNKASEPTGCTVQSPARRYSLGSINPLPPLPKDAGSSSVQLPAVEAALQAVYKKKESLTGNITDQISKGDDAIHLRLTSIEGKVDNSAKTIEEVKESLEYTQKDVEELKTDLINTQVDVEQLKVDHDTLKSQAIKAQTRSCRAETQATANEVEIDTIKKDLQQLKNDNESLKQANKLLNDKMERAENYSRKNNIIIEGLDEEMGEDLEEKIGSVTDTLGLPRLHMREFHRLRYQKRVQGRSVRPVIVKLENFTDKAEIFRNVFKLKGQNIYVREDLSRETLKKQAELRPFLAQAKKMDKKARFIHDSILVNGSLYNREKLEKLPSDVKRNVGCRRGNGITLFKGKHCPLSNLFDVEFTVDNVVYRSNEHYYQSQKCIEMEKRDTYQKVMKAKTGHDAITLGRKVEAPTEWTYSRGVSIMEKGATAKFQVEECRDFLLSSSGIIAEATTNGYWGIGIDIGPPEALDMEQWHGSNLMGEVLTNLRDRLIESLQSDNVMDTTTP